MKHLALLGAGGHGYSVLDVATSSGYEEIFFFDDKVSLLVAVNGGMVRGTISDFLASTPGAYDTLVSIGDNYRRLSIFNRLSSLGHSIVNLTHTFSHVSHGVVLGIGSVIMPGAVVNVGTVIGAAAIINSGAVIEHHCSIGNGTHIAPRTVICGGVCIGDRTLIGAGSIVTPRVKIGQDVIIGAGSVVLSDVPDGIVLAGNPAKLLRMNSPL